MRGICSPFRMRIMRISPRKPHAKIATKATWYHQSRNGLKPTARLKSMARLLLFGKTRKTKKYTAINNKSIGSHHWKANAYSKGNIKYIQLYGRKNVDQSLKGAAICKPSWPASMSGLVL